MMMMIYPHKLFDSKHTATAMEAETQKTLTKPMQKETFGHADDWGEAAAGKNLGDICWLRREQHPAAGDMAG